MKKKKLEEPLGLTYTKSNRICVPHCIECDIINKWDSSQDSNKYS